MVLQEHIDRLTVARKRFKHVVVEKSTSPFRGIKFRQTGCLTIDPMGSQSSIAWNWAKEALACGVQAVIPFKGYVGYYVSGK